MTRFLVNAISEVWANIEAPPIDNSVREYICVELISVKQLIFNKTGNYLGTMK